MNVAHRRMMANGHKNGLKHFAILRLPSGNR